jgi:CRP/FNR family transcriptional regulator, cyclic AMP receptor protein
MVEINIFKNDPDLRTLEAGDVLFREGEEGEVMFAVVDGTLDVSVRGTVVDQVHAGGIIGEMAILDKAPRSATVTAASRTTVAPVDRQRFKFYVQVHPTFALLVMETMAERLRHARGTTP